VACRSRPAFTYHLSIHIAKKFRVNNAISAPTVRLINEAEEQLGIMGRDKALAMAKEKELDLVEVAPNVSPPVCKIMDFGKHLYKVKKQDAKQRKASKAKDIKGVRLSIRTGQHDLDVKVARAKKFLGDGHPLKIQLIFKGREITHMDLGFEKMNMFIESISDAGKVENPPKKQGYQLFAIINPIK